MSFRDYVPPPVVERLLNAASSASNCSQFGTFLFDDVALSKPIVKQAHIAARAAIKRVNSRLPVGLTLAIQDVQDEPPVKGIEEVSFGMAELGPGQERAARGPPRERGWGSRFFRLLQA